MQSRVHEVYPPLKFHVYTSNRFWDMVKKSGTDKTMGQTHRNTQGRIASVTIKSRAVTKCDLLPPPAL